MSVLSDKNCDVHLHAEIEVLKQALAEKQSQLIAMETACLRESDRQVELEDSIIAWQDKYDRLYESHKRVQKVNQNLEDKLLKLVDRNSGERAQLTSDVATLSVRLAQANYNITNLQREIERYKTDISLAIQLLQCKPDNFVSQKITSLPVEIQSKVTSYMRLETNSHSDSEGSTTGGGSVGVATSGSYRVVPASDSPPPLCPFPPTAMVYSMRGIDATSNTQESINDQMISPSVMAKFLEDELKLNDVKHCDSCQCTSKDLTVLAESAKFYSIATQTILHGDANNSLCLRCNSNLNSPSRTNSPYIMKLVKSSDSVISETKSSVSNSTQNDKLFTPVKKDDLMVNPILGHHRLCDRNVSSKPIILESIIPIKTESIIDIDVENQPHKNIPMTASNLLLQTPEIRSIDIARTTENFISSGDGIDKLQNGSISRHGTATGSTNSLWSKTSSSEGHKMFETFNRNLIKTIKSENPKISGPRLCSLRIQNGSTNILLDSTEPNLTPIVYTRRSKFLDEELDDNRDIITTATSTTSRVCDTQISMVMGNGNKTDSEKCREVNSKENSIIVNSNNIMPQLKDAKSISANNSISNLSINKTAALTSTTVTVTAKQRLEKLESDINSSKNANSCTQSSSISSDVDMQESALLRRQQLTRVAEWVQNNSQLDNIGPPISQNSSMEALSIVDSEYKKSKLNNNNNINNDIASEKINLTALASTAVITNVVITSSNAHQMQFKSTQNEIAVVDNNDSHGSDQLTICTTSLCDDNKLISNNDITIAQNIITKQQQLQLQQTYFENGNNDNDKNDDRTDKGNVDLAQMEYNVKQFLLKQNEWSIHNKHAPIVKAPHRTETNL